MVAAIVIYNFWTVILRIAFTEMSEEVISDNQYEVFLKYLLPNVFLKGAQSRYFELFWPRTELSLN